MELASTSATLGPVELRLSYRRTEILSEPEVEAAPAASSAPLSLDALLAQSAIYHNAVVKRLTAIEARLSNAERLIVELEESATGGYHALTNRLIAVEAALARLERRTLLGWLSSIWNRWTS